MDEVLDLAVAKAMREAAERAIIPRFRKGQPVEGVYKSAGELVTSADKESEEILSESLHHICPGAEIIGEESSANDPALDRRLREGTCWIIDPLDGTANFAAGHGPFGVMVALAQDGEPVAGWILDPLSGRFCSAQIGKGAAIDGVAFRSKTREGNDLTVAITRLISNARDRERLAVELSRQFNVQDSPRCAAEQYPCIATGQVDVTLFTRTLAWDHAAGAVFLNAAGGMAARPDGSPYRLDVSFGGLIAANSPENWEKIARYIGNREFDLGRAAKEVALG